MATNSIKILSDIELSGSMAFANNLAGFPESPKPHTMVVVDGVPHMYTELINGSGYYSWTPIGYRQSAYLHTQGVASTVWIVSHNFNTVNFGYFVYDHNHHLVTANIDIIDTNTFAINLTEAITGTAVVFSMESIFTQTVNAALTVGVDTITLRDANGSLTVNNNAVAMQTSLGAEIARAQNAETSLVADMAAEVYSRTASDAALGVRIDNMLSNIESGALDSLTEVVNAFQGADSSLSGAITALSDHATSALASEALTARAAEVALGGRIDSDSTAARAAEASLQSNIAVLTSSVSAEITRATTAENAITANVASEANTRLNAVSNVSNSITSEVTRATAVEATLTSSIATEIAARTGAVTSAIATAGNDASTKVATEATRAQATEATLTTAISLEISRASIAEGVLATNLAAEAAIARSAEATNATAITAEVTARTNAVTAAITTAATDTTTKVAAEAAIRLTNDATTLASAKTYTDGAIVPAAKAYLGAVTGDIIPETTLLYNLGSLTHQFHSVYVGPGTLYVNGKAVIQDNSDTMTFSTDPNQNMKLQTTGSGHLQLQTGTGVIDVMSSLAIESGKRITDSAGAQVEFGAAIQMNGLKIIGLAAPTVTTDAATMGYVQSLTTADLTIVRTSGVQSISGVKTFVDGIVVAGDLTVSGNITTINSETIKLADNLIDLNSNFTAGNPTENAGIRIIRGDYPAAQLRWNESGTKWEMSGDSTNYSGIATAADIATEASARTAGDATSVATAASDATTKSNAALASAKIYADAAVSTEAIARNLAVATNLNTANAYTDSSIALEVTARNAAIAVSVPTSIPKLTTARNINGVAFDGTTNITVTASAATLTGTLDGGSY